MATYETLKALVQTLRAEGRISDRPNNEERANWAYGTTKIENDDVTLEMAIEAVKEDVRR
jgi:hypothetical protein